VREIVIHSSAQALAALAAARTLNRSVILASTPGAALQTGPAWFRAVIDQATERYPDVAVTAILDCGDQPGAVMGALRVGLTHLRFAGPAETRTKLAEMGAIFAAPADAALDLLDASDPEAACRTFLDSPDLAQA
jgi:hypothetical protein